MEHVDLILFSRYVITLDDFNRVIPWGAVAVRDGVIIDVGESTEIRRRYSAVEEVERPDHVVIPGLVDCHVHTQQFLLRSAIGDRLLQIPPVWTKVLVPFEELMGEDLARLSSVASILNMLRNGVTFFVEAGAPYPEVLAREASAAGIKGVVTLATYDIVEGRRRRTEEVLRRIEELLKTVAEGSIRVWMSIRQVMMASEELVDYVLDVCRGRGIGLTMHLAEYQGEVDYTLSLHGMRPLELMMSKGLGSVSPVILAHGVYLSPEEIGILGKHRLGVCWCPTVDSWLMGPHWVGLRDIESLRLGLGSDGGAWNRLDILHEMKVAKALGKALSNALLYYKAGLGSLDLLKMATGWGGELVGERTGKLDRGYPADLAVLSLRSVRNLPVVDPVEAVVNYLEGDSVTDVVVNGRFVIREGKVLTIDEERVVKELVEAEERVKELLRELSRGLPLSF